MMSQKRVKSEWRAADEWLGCEVKGESQYGVKKKNVGTNVAAEG